MPAGPLDYRGPSLLPACSNAPWAGACPDTWPVKGSMVWALRKTAEIECWATQGLDWLAAARGGPHTRRVWVIAGLDTARKLLIRYWRNSNSKELSFFQCRPSFVCEGNFLFPEAVEIQRVRIISTHYLSSLLFRLSSLPRPARARSCPPARSPTLSRSRSLSHMLSL